MVSQRVLEILAAAYIYSAKANEKTLIVPDKDADGLSSGVILHRTLVLLGLSSENISVHLLHKGCTIHSQSEKEIMQKHKPAYVFVLDQGSRSAPPVVDDPSTTTLVIDHHFAHSTEFPERSFHVSACHSPPVATSALLTYELCKPLHDAITEQCSWLCAIGTQGDLGNTIKWESPFPDMRATFKTHTKKAVADAVSLLNAPRRTATYDVISAWEALLGASTPAQVLTSKRLLSARAEVNAEVERCTHTPPKFSADGTIAVLRIASAAQVHPVIATRWAGHLSSAALQIIMVANSGYLPGKINFSCRIARTARSKEPPVDIIARLKSVAADHESGTLLQRMGEDFARGHVQASGGIVGEQEFQELMDVLKVGEKVEKTKVDGEDTSPKKKRKADMPAQKNTLSNYFVKR